MLTGVVVDYFDRLNCEIVNCSSLEIVNIRGDGDANFLFENQSNRFFPVCAVRETLALSTTSLMVVVNFGEAKKGGGSH